MAAQLEQSLQCFAAEFEKLKGDHSTEKAERNAHHWLFHESVHALEQSLLDAIARERDIREAEVCELKEMAGEEALAPDAHHGSALALIAAEKAARGALVDQLNLNHGTIQGRIEATHQVCKILDTVVKVLDRRTRRAEGPLF